MSSQAEWHEELSSAFLKARDLESPARAAFLRELGETDAEMAEWVERMLAAEMKSSPLLGGSSRGPFIKFTAPEITGSRIGQYTITRRIGAGGMGAVYEAEQDSPKRSVAVKILPAGLGSRTAARRFEYESSVLARLRHPAIAQVYEAGVHSENGLSLPFFAMEFVPEASPITTYSRTEKLKLSEIVQLFIRVCDAVHHGHQRGVIHRDLKPDNILVDAFGNPKIIDFGVARAIDRDVHAITLQTEAGQLVGTVPYMSPEQVAGSAADLDIRTDVYSLGVVLFELVTGRLPFDFTGKSFVESIDLIRKTTPARAAALSSRIPADLDTILSKSLEKERDRRFASVADLSADLKRFLKNEPITARQPSVGYQLRKFAARNKTMVAAAALVIVALIAGVIAERFRANQAIEARNDAIAAQQAASESRKQAEIEAARATRVVEFLNGMLSKVTPDEAQGETVTVQEVLDAVAADIGVNTQDSPEVEATVRYIVGKTYFDLGQYQQARDMLTAVLTIHDDRGIENDETINTLSVLGATYGKLNDAQTAMSAIDRAIELADKSSEVNVELHLELQRRHAEQLFSVGKTDEAIAEFETLVEQSATRLGENSEATMFAKASFAMMLVSLDRNEEAIDFLNEALAWYNDNKPESIGNVMAFRQALAAAEAEVGHYDKSIQALSRLEEDVRSHFGPDHPRLAELLNHIGGMLRRVDQRGGSESRIREALAIQINTFGEGHVFVARTLNNLASTLLDRDRLEEAIELHERSESIYQDKGIIDSDEYATHLHRYANTLRLAQQCTRALTLERRCFEITRAIHGESDPQTTNVRSLLAAIEMTCGDPANAADMLKAVLENDRQELPDDHPVLARSAMNVASASFRAGRIEDALRYSEEAISRFNKIGPSGVELLRKAMALRSLMLLVNGQPSRAIDLAEEAIELQGDLTETTESHLLAKTVIAAAYLTRGDAELGVKLMDETYEALKAAHPQWPELAVIALTVRAKCLKLKGESDQVTAMIAQAARILDQTFSPSSSFVSWARDFVNARY